MCKKQRAKNPAVLLLQMFWVIGEKISEVGYSEHGGLRVLHGWAGVTAMIRNVSGVKTLCLHMVWLSPFLCGLQHGLHSLLNGGSD